MPFVSQNHMMAISFRKEKFKAKVAREIMKIYMQRFISHCVFGNKL